MEKIVQINQKTEEGFDTIYPKVTKNSFENFNNEVGQVIENFNFYKIIFGQYVGDNTKDREIIIGVHPSAVLLFADNAFTYGNNGNRYGGLYIKPGETGDPVRFTNQGFIVSYYDFFRQYTNSSGYVYYYTVFYK